MADVSISVVMPVYKGDVAAHFDVALQSVCEQTVSPLEILIVQDGPIGEELGKVLQKWCVKNEHIKPIVLEKNQGLSVALNAGIDAAKGEWIARMDADDICKPYRFEKQVEYIKAHPELSILGSWIDEFSETPEQVTGTRRVPETHKELRSYAQWRCPFNHMTVMYKTAVVRKLGKYQNFGAVGDDYELWARFLVNDYKSANIQENLVDARAGDAFFGKRRRGLNYLKNEVKEVNALYKLGLFNRGIWLFHVSVKTVVRLVPSFLVKPIYKLIRISS